MKKTSILFIMVYACSIWAQAQVVPDRNWNTINLMYADDFLETGRYWDNLFVDQPLQKWQAYFREWWECGVANIKDCQVFDTAHCRFRPLQKHGRLNLISEYCGHRLQPDEVAAPGIYDAEDCLNESPHYYRSGAIESLKKFRYGFYEMRCMLPIHRGAFSAFWLFGPTDSTYEEIDFFEWTMLGNEPYPQMDNIGNRYFVGIWYNPESNNYDESDGIGRAQYRGHGLVNTAEGGPLLSDWNVFGCEWSPTFVRWYLNGRLVHAYYKQDSIPQSPMRLKVNYTIDATAVEGDNPLWLGADSLVIDYIRIYKLRRNCDEDVVINTLEEFYNYDYGLKRTITIQPEDHMNIGSAIEDTFRATERISLTNMTIPLGSRVSFIMQDCQIVEEVVDE